MVSRKPLDSDSNYINTEELIKWDESNLKIDLVLLKQY